MKRWLSCILIFSIASANVDAATDVERLGPCDEQVEVETHSVHGARAVSKNERGATGAPADDGAIHFCHCGAHAPALLSSIEPSPAPASEPSPSVSLFLYGTH